MTTEEPITYVEVSAGVSSATLAFHELGWKPLWFSEIAKFPSAVLNYHYPHVPNLGDMRTILPEQKHKKYGRPNVLVGGTPCQAFSIAGLRGGMDDDRGNLSREFCRIADALRPTWVLWENVPGVLSSYTEVSKVRVSESPSEGRWDDLQEEESDFGAIIQGLQEVGYSVAWRILDGQFFGIPQRRRRVFLVGHLGDSWGPPLAVLLNREGMQRDAAEINKKRKATPRANTHSNRADAGQGEGGYILHKEVIPPIMASFGKNLGSSGQDEKTGYGHIILMSSSQAKAEVSDNGIAPTLCSSNHEGPIVYAQNLIHMKGSTISDEPGIAPSITQEAARTLLVNPPDFLRRLTPKECERLMGYPDNYTQIPWRGKPRELCPKGHRYRACGNGIMVPKMRWIGKRLQFVHNLLKKQG